MAHSVLRYHYFTRYVLSVINFIVLPPPPPSPSHPSRYHRAIDSFASLETGSRRCVLLANKPEPVNRFSAIPDGKRIEEKSWHRSRSQLFRESSFLLHAIESPPQPDTMLRKFASPFCYSCQLTALYDFVLRVIIVIFFIEIENHWVSNVCFDEEENLDADEIIYCGRVDVFFDV